jgi:hypothetical protein
VLLNKLNTIQNMSTSTIYIIRSKKDGCNLVYVKTLEEARRICADLPGMFTWDAVSCLEPEEQ